MDPLSITASFIAIVGVSGHAAGAIRKLAAIKEAPDIALALSNEISDLHLVITAVRDALQRQRAITLPRSAVGSHTSVTSLLQNALDKAQEMEALYNSLTTGLPRASDPLKFSTIRWLRRQSKVRKMLEDLKAIRLKLSGAVEILTLYVGPIFFSLILRK